jgi:hypothetical protein
VDAANIGGLTPAEAAAQRLRIDYAAAEVLRAFRKSGIDSIVLKGAPLVRWLYDSGERRSQARPAGRVFVAPALASRSHPARNAPVAGCAQRRRRTRSLRVAHRFADRVDVSRSPVPWVRTHRVGSAHCARVRPKLA